MQLEVDLPGPVAEPRMWVRQRQILVMALQPGSIEVGTRRSELTRHTYQANDVALCHRYLEKWIRTDDLPFLSIAISDAALAAAHDEECDERDEVELHPVSLVDAQVGALVGVVNAERTAGFPLGPLFLDCVEQALAVALVNGYAVTRRTMRTKRGGLAPAHVRKITELVHGNMEESLSLQEMARSIGLSTAHFAQMFRKSTGESPHQFVLRQKIERAKDMLRTAEAGVLEVAVACGFKTQQHFARVFRRVCGFSPTEYRQEFLR